MNALPHDTALPQLATALDESAIGKLLARELPAGMRLERCRIDRVKYRPRRNCSVSYRLDVRDASGRVFEQAVGARWCRGGEAAQRHAKALRRGTRASPAGPALTHSPALDLFATWWPNDAKLDAPAELCDDAHLRAQHLPDIVAALSGGRGRLLEHRTALVQWVPEHRACARVELRFETAPGTATSCTLYAKTDAERGAAATFAVMQALHTSAAQASGLLETPRPLLCRGALHWQQAIDGRALLDVEPQLGAQRSAQIGALIAALHATAAPAPRTIEAAELRAEPHAAAELLCLVEPGWRALLERLLRALDAAALPDDPPVTLHGDLHPRNLLLDAESRLALIDLDSVRRGPALIEIGGWIADLLYSALLNARAPRSAADVWRAFLHGYAAAGGKPPPAPLLAWAVAHRLLCERAWRCVTNLKPGRLQTVPALLLLADAIARAGSVDAACRAEFDRLAERPNA